MNENHLTEIIIGKAIEVHKILGPGLLESAYQKCLQYELLNTGLKVEIEKTSQSHTKKPKSPKVTE